MACQLVSLGPGPLARSQPAFSARRSGALSLRAPSAALPLQQRSSLRQRQTVASTRQLRVQCAAADAAYPVQDRSKTPRLIQHKNEAKMFYRWLSIVYDHIVNPGHWTKEMRTDALEPALLNDANLKVVDVGGGTGFCTQGVVKTVKAENVTLIDQSPHQLAKAKQKADLQGVTIVEGDAEDLPFETDTFDRYVSAGSIEYWPEPQRGITEAYRVIKPGGLACMIGPVHPTFWLSRWFADMWMLFPTEQEYLDWFTRAGFENVKLKRIGPKWYRGVRRHGLIMGCSVTGTKPRPGPSPLELPIKMETSEAPNTPLVTRLIRFFVGSAAGFYYILVPVYMWIKNLIWPKWLPGF